MSSSQQDNAEPVRGSIAWLQKMHEPPPLRQMEAETVRGALNALSDEIRMRWEGHVNTLAVFSEQLDRTERVGQECKNAQLNIANGINTLGDRLAALAEQVEKLVERLDAQSRAIQHLISAMQMRALGEKMRRAKAHKSRTRAK